MNILGPNFCKWITSRVFSLCQNGRQSMQSIPVQVELIFERGFFSGMNVVVVVVLFLAQSLSLPIPQMRCIIAASNNRNSLGRSPPSSPPLSSRAAASPVVKPLSISPARSLARTKRSEARSRQVKLDNERAANINFLLLLAKLGLPEGGARRVPPDFGLLSAADIVPLVQGVNSIDQLKFQ